MKPAPASPSTVGHHIAARAAAYGQLEVFQLFANDRVPVAAFPRFFREQYMAARWFQDLIWALTDIAEGPLAAFAAEHRRKDSGHHRWMQADLERFGLPPMTDDDWFAQGALTSRVQLARILARTHEASDEERLVMLACLEAAGEVTLGTLNAYVHRHDLADRTSYLGDQHVAVEARQADAIAAAIAAPMASTSSSLLALVDLVFDALGAMFSDGGRRHYPELLGSMARAA